jgi:hypothetical protein
VLHNFCQFLAAAARRNLTEKQRENKMPSRLPLANQLLLSFLKWRKHFEVKHDPGEIQLEREENGGLDKRLTNGYKNPAALFMGTQHFSIHFRKGKKFK